MKADLIDANVLLRYMTADVSEQALRCRALFQRVLDGKESVEIPLLVLAETLWTLVKFYKQPKEEVAESLSIILKTPGIHVHEKGLILETLDLYRNSNLSFTDVYLLVLARSRGVGVYSFDRVFDRFDIRRKDP